MNPTSMRRWLAHYGVGLVCVGAIVVGALYWGPRVFSSSTAWSIQPTPAPRNGDSPLAGVACSSANACMAVGQRTAGARVATVAMRWNGRRWQLEQPVNVASASSTYLTAVACPSTAWCLAVGDYQTRSGLVVPVAEEWGGREWTVGRVPAPTGTYLTDVSCANPTACMAVGLNYLGGTRYAFAARWNGRGWTIAPGAGGVGTELTGVSCPSTADCTAVGDSGFRSPVTRAMAERWAGGTWAIQPTPAPNSAQSNALAAVSCPVSTSCIAVGEATSANGVTLFSENWAGGAWSYHPVPVPGGSASPLLVGVACFSTRFCSAVGQASNAPLADHWDGSGWTLEASAAPPGGSTADGRLVTVSCVSARLCVAAGDYLRRSLRTLGFATLIERRS